MTSVEFRNAHIEETHKIIPRFVHVRYSESSEFGPDGSLLSFEEFESIASRVAHKNTGGGYLKTDVLILFSDGSTYKCRIDLCPEETGFRQRTEADLRRGIPAQVKAALEANPNDFFGVLMIRSHNFLRRIRWE